MTITPNAAFPGRQWLTLEFLYTNHKMETEHRRAKPTAFWFGHSEFHRGEQCFMEAMDLDKNESRNFAVRDMRDVRVKQERKDITQGAIDLIGDALRAVERGHDDVAMQCLKHAIWTLEMGARG